MRLTVHGAGGHAKVVISAALDLGIEIAAVTGLPGGPTQVLGYPVLPSSEGIDSDGFIVAIGDNDARRATFDAQVAAGYTPLAVVHPSAVVSRGVVIGAGTFVAPGAVINVDTRIGANSIVNTRASIDHDCVIGDHVHIGPGCTLCGAVRLEDGVLLGVGTSVIPGRQVGAHATVGGGAAVTRDLDARGVYAGVPAIRIRD